MKHIKVSTKKKIIIHTNFLTSDTHHLALSSLSSLHLLLCHQSRSYESHMVFIGRYYFFSKYSNHNFFLDKLINNHVLSLTHILNY